MDESTFEAFDNPAPGVLGCSTQSSLDDFDAVDSNIQGNENENKDSQRIPILWTASSIRMMECVPSDEELFAIGWAKALDPKTGYYYFFTLD